MRPSAGARHKRRPVPGSLVRGVYLPRAADASAFSLATYGIPMLVLATTGSAAWTGLAFALEWTPRLAVVTFAGTVVDRHGPALVFRLACTLWALAVLTAAVVLPAQSGGTEVTVMILAAASGAVNQLSYVAAETTGTDASRKAGDRAHRVQSVLLKAWTRPRSWPGPRSPDSSSSRPVPPDCSPHAPPCPCWQPY